MPKKADNPTSKTPLASSDTPKTDVPATDATTSDETAVTPIISARKIITVSHEDDDPEASAASAPAEPATRVIKKSRIEPLSASDSQTIEAEPETEAAASTTDAKAKQSASAATAAATAKADPKTDTDTDEESEAEPSDDAEESPAETPPAETPDPEVAPAESGFTLDEGDEGNNPLDQAQSEADKAASAKQAERDKLVESETYFLPINSVEKRRAKHMLWAALLLVLVLGVAAVAWASSGGYLTIPGL